MCGFDTRAVLFYLFNRVGVAVRLLVRLLLGPFCIRSFQYFPQHASVHLATLSPCVHRLHVLLSHSQPEWLQSVYVCKIIGTIETGNWIFCPNGKERERAASVHNLLGLLGMQVAN